MTTDVTTEPLCRIDNLRIGFAAHDGTVTEAVRGVSLTVNRGERLGVVGESGSGKSLTGRALLGLLPDAAQWSADALCFEGEDLLAMRPKDRRRLCGTKMSMILQDPKYSLNPVMTVGAQMREAFRLREPKLGARAMREKIVAALDAVHIRNPAQVADAYPHELSGGMGQRVMIAMMLIPEPDVIIADEPTSALDITVRLQVLDVLDELIAKRGIGLIFISHDLNLVRHFCDRVLVMYAGRVVESCAASDLERARHPYTRGLIDTLPRIDRRRERLPQLQRDPAWKGL